MAVSIVQDENMKALRTEVANKISLPFTQGHVTFYIQNLCEIIKLQESEFYVLETHLK